MATSRLSSIAVIVTCSGLLSAPDSARPAEAPALHTEDARPVEHVVLIALGSTLASSMELLTGRESPCQLEDCDARPQYGLADAILDEGADSASDVAIFASSRRVAHVADVSPSPFVSAGTGAGDRADGETLALALGYLQREQPRFVFIGLGCGTTPDVHAANALISQVEQLLETWRGRGERSALFVVDVGMAPGSSTRLVASGDGIQRGKESLVGPDVKLRDVPHTIAALLDVPFEPAGANDRAIGESMFATAR